MYHTVADGVIDQYQENGAAWVEAREGRFIERLWLGRFLAALPPNERDVLDLGCGLGRPIAERLDVRGCRITGVDGAAALVKLTRERPCRSTDGSRPTCEACRPWGRSTACSHGTASSISRPMRSGPCSGRSATSAVRWRTPLHERDRARGNRRYVRGTAALPWQPRWRRVSSSASDERVRNPPTCRDRSILRRRNDVAGAQSFDPEVEALTACLPPRPGWGRWMRRDGRSRDVCSLDRGAGLTARGRARPRRLR